MKTLIKNTLRLRNLIPVFIVASFGFISIQDDGWLVPEKYKTMKNPVAADAESIATGTELYAKHCKSCHGKNGEGDGPKAAELENSCGDFTEKEFKDQSDGSLFYKIITGKDDMPEFRKKITDDEEIWSIVNYMRTFK